MDTIRNAADSHNGGSSAISYAELTERELWNTLFQRIEEEASDYTYRLDLRTRDELINTADEIDAMMTCRAELIAQGESLPREELVFLLRQDRPLETLSNAWLAHRNVEVGEVFQSLLAGLCDEARQKASEPPPKTVRELLERHPEECVHLMTPCGFVDVDPNEAERLLRGEAVVAHPGASGYQMPVEAEELLEMEVLSLKIDEQGCWYALTEHPHQQQEHSQQKLEMTM